MDSSEPQDAAPASDSADSLKTTVDLVAKTGELIQVGDFEIDDNGRLQPRPDGTPIAFGFSYRGVDFLAKVETGSNPLVSIDAELGKLPYRAEIGEHRDLTKRIVSASGALPRGKLSLTDSQDIYLRAEIAPAVPLTPIGVLSALTAVLLDFKPYIDLLHEVMLAPPETGPRLPAVQSPAT